MEKQHVYIFDLDGTISNPEHRRHLVRGEHKDWAAFYKESASDPPVVGIIKTMQALRSSGAMIIIFSGRSEEVRHDTAAWLSNHGVPYDYLVMRPAGSRTPDDILKKGWYHGLPDDIRKRVVMVYDDRNKVVAMWRSLGLICAQVAPGDS